jgi:hypothetical protein
MTTDAQETLINQLISDRRQTVLADPELVNIDTDKLTTTQASQLIDRLKRIPKDALPDMPPVVRESMSRGVNKYDKPCSSCGHIVAAGTGYYYRQNNVVLTHHKVDGCQSGPAPEQVTYDAGLYITDNDIVLLYHYGKALYGKVWRDNKFQALYYAKSFVRKNNGRKMTPDEIDTFSIVAGDVGKHIKTCVFCSRPLSDEGDNRSMERGYGPTCASKYGLPWG